MKEVLSLTLHLKSMTSKKTWTFNTEALLEILKVKPVYWKLGFCYFNRSFSCLDSQTSRDNTFVAICVLKIKKINKYEASISYTEFFYIYARDAKYNDCNRYVVRIVVWGSCMSIHQHKTKLPAFSLGFPDTHPCFYVIGEESGRRGPI